MHPERLSKAPRCLAKTRKGSPCQAPAVRGRARCRMHGGTNPGPPAGNRNALRHGWYAEVAVGLRGVLREILRGVNTRS
ncbi:HGGxSTG domain-containing protein [Phenylobacterium sp.]|uniref:HGGxSTG domain-containing protein n=1 Tax=Phenylobacterium sp. TaxID=1871053 RepID=UPI0034554D04